MNELLDALKTIRDFFTGPHSNEHKFLCAFHGKFHNKAAKTPRPWADFAFSDNEGRSLLGADQIRDLKAWALAEFGSDDYETPGLNEVREYLELIPPMKAACDEARRILTSKAKVPKTFKRKAMIAACKELKRTELAATYQTGYAKLFAESIDLLELHSKGDFTAQTKKQLAEVPSDRFVFRKHTGEHTRKNWEVIFDGGERMIYEDSVGMQYIHFLLQNPRKVFSPEELVVHVQGKEKLEKAPMLTYGRDRKFSPECVNETMSEIRDYDSQIEGATEGEARLLEKEKNDLIQKLIASGFPIDEDGKLLSKSASGKMSDGKQSGVAKNIHKVKAEFKHTYPKLFDHLISLRTGGKVGYFPENIPDWSL